MSKSPEPYLHHILDEINFLLENSKDLSKENFLADAILKRAFVRGIEIIGEAAKHLSSELTGQYSEIDWRAIKGTRDRLIHGYFGIDYDIIWDIVTTEIPKLKTAVERMLRDM